MAIGAYGRKTKNPVIIIRAGDDAKEYPDPYDFCVTGTMEDDTYVTFEGLAGSETTWDRVEAAIRCANEMTGRPVKCIRLGDAPRELVQTSGLNGGRIIMTRKDIPELRATKHHTGRDGNNQIDKAAVIATTEQLLAGYKAGAVDVVSIETTELAVAGEKRRASVTLVVELP